ncbi:phosphotransferase [Agrococcus sp. Marseille-Q4369]|uniref:phosphotransferase enzyme family protein n=1 Tax=Agrococcus sp. Marseille-Q4369 TaxID=2810513 RepID=UPI001B8D5752|nr:phosphotransferase [Agrococcus sp. Marseille-Q4369]QUW18452.1 phosphotransferase [Agrococcus sp. Marseille-Q4369]
MSSCRSTSPSSHARTAPDARLAGEQAWIAAIAAETDVCVPEPVRAPDGRWCVEVDAPAVGRSLLVTAASWLDGRDAEPLEPASARALGRTMATLHLHAETWQPPRDGALPPLTEPLFGDEDALDSAPDLRPQERAVLAEARERTGEAFARLHEGASLRALHADLHGGNLKWHDGSLAVFDFDDAGIGLPVLGLAISTYYLRGEDPALEAALRDSYAQVAPVPPVAHADLEALVAARQLLLANALLITTTAGWRAEAERYAHTAAARLEHWLRTGTFTCALA